MARRKDHTPEELRELIVQAACALVAMRGRGALTARNLAAKIGYAPGTIYNVFPDMDAVLLAVQGRTLADMQEHFVRQTATTPPDFDRIVKLARAYGAFAQQQPRRWLALFAQPHQGKLPKWYQRQLDCIFTFIESQLQLCLQQNPATSRHTARLLWACLHGITMLTLDGRLQAIGQSEADTMVDTLLLPYKTPACVVMAS